jgi:hypothetical protein
MPEKRTRERASRDKRQGKAPTTQAGEFVREEMRHRKQGRHSRGNPKQAVAIGLSKARRAGVKVGPPKNGKASTRRKAERDLKAGQRTHRRRGVKASASRRSQSSTSHQRSSSSSRRKSASQSRSRA